MKIVSFGPIFCHKSRNTIIILNRCARFDDASILIRFISHQKTHLSLRLQRFRVENDTNHNPMAAIFRLDAGFGNSENLALLIEMGFEIYSKPYGNWLSGTLSKMSITRSTDWEKVGKNAEMMAWKAVQLENFPYPLDLGYERFWQSPGCSCRESTDSSQPKLAYSGVIHFGQRNVTADLPGWFHDYNARQTIEAANKESKQVFEVHHIKVRSQPAMHLQEHFALFAANFVRIAADWLANQCPQVPDGWRKSTHPAVKEQVKVGAHSSARIEWFGSDCLLRFAQRSVYAGRSLLVRRLSCHSTHLAHPNLASFLPFSAPMALFAQNLC
jgi:hypothetical protein